MVTAGPGVGGRVLPRQLSGSRLYLLELLPGRDRAQAIWFRPGTANPYHICRSRADAHNHWNCDWSFGQEYPAGQQGGGWQFVVGNQGSTSLANVSQFSP